MSMKYFTILCALCAFYTAFPVTIIIDPAGDAKQTGRIIGDTFERAITLEIAHALKDELEHSADDCAVIITRSPGDVVQPLQNATFANRLSPALYLSIHVFKSTDPKPSLALYQYSLGDSFVTKSYDLAFVPYDHAHRTQGRQTAAYAQALYNSLNQSQYCSLLTVYNVVALPFAPLAGITAPALGLEIGIADSHDWHAIIQPLATSLALTVRAS